MRYRVVHVATYALQRLVAVVLGLLDPVPVGLGRLVAVGVVLALIVQKYSKK
jgi:hypothetical protein